MHNFLSSFVIARQVAGELHSVTWVVLQFFLLREALHDVELSSTFRNGLQQLATQCITPPTTFLTILRQF